MTNARDSEVRDHFVYRLFDGDGNLLYVGCTKRPARRWQEHRSTRPHMTDRVRRVHMFGPTTRRVARDIEYFAIRRESPEFGWTPEKHAAKTARSAWVNRRTGELTKQGLDLHSAITRAVDEVDAVIPNPMANEYPPVIRRKRTAAS